MTETPALSGFRVDLLHKEILRKLAYHEAQVGQPRREGESVRELGTRETYNIAAHDTLRDLRGLLESCIESERRERAAYSAAGEDHEPRNT